MTALSEGQQALARSRLYGLLARSFVRGVDARTLAQVEALGWSLGVTTESLDELAAGHHATFALGVFPYAGVFLDRSASAGACADRVRSYYVRAGFTPVLDELCADHLGIELAFLAFVTGAQADAHEDRVPERAAALDRLLAEFLDACVLAYLPALLVAVEGLGSGLWATIAAETLAITAEHRSRLPGPITPARLEPATTGAELLADPRTGLLRIAEHLLTPAATGVFLSRADIASLGRQHELPRGFGSRLLMLDNLLRSAVDYGQLPQLLATLDDHLVQRDHTYARLSEAYDLGPAIAPWREALAATRALLDRLATTSPTPPP